MTHIQEVRCKKILNHYGERSQLMQTAEECAELIRAIARVMKHRRGTWAETRYNFIEELADVEIMLFQMHLTLTEEERDMLEQIKNKKINRQLQRMAREE